MALQRITSSSGLKRIASIVGMAALWPSLLNQLLYPVSFTFDRTGDPLTYSFHLVYSVLLILFTALLTVLYRRCDRFLLSNGKVVAAFGAIGSIGILLVGTLDFSTATAEALIGAGVGLVALFVPVHFLFWSLQFSHLPERTGYTDMSLSLLLFCLFTGTRTILQLPAFGCAAIFPILSGAMALLANADAQKAVLPRSSYPLSQLPWHFVAPCLVFILFCNVGIIVFNGQAQLQAQPTEHRFMLFFGAALAFALLALLPHVRKIEQHSLSAFAFAVVSLFFIGAMLIACLFSLDMLKAGTVPLITADIVIIGWLWMLTTQIAAQRSASTTQAAGLLLCLVIAGPRALRALFMYEGYYLPHGLNAMQIFAITAAAAFVVTALAIATLMLFFMRERNEAVAHIQAQAAEVVAAAAAQQEEQRIDQALMRLADQHDLSRREMEIVRVALRTDNAQQIADELFIAKSTVYTHLKHIYRKCGVNSKTELMAQVERFR